MKKLHFILLLCCCTFSSVAQKGWELGGWVGVGYYFGDLNTTFNLGSPGIATGLVGRYNFNNRLCLKMSANYISVSADDANSSNSFERARNLNFQSDVIDGTFQFEFNFLPYVHGSRDEFFTPYLLAGFSVFNFNPQTEYLGETRDLSTFGTEGQFRGEEYYFISGGLTYGGGIKFDLSYRWSLNLELSARKIFTDYIDDVSGNYPDFDDLEALRGPIAVALSDRSLTSEGTQIGGQGRQRGNGRNNDTYATLGVSLLYYFGSLECPW